MFNLERKTEKMQRKQLTDAIKEWEHCNKYSYKHITDLLLKKASGSNAKELKISRNNNNALDVLSLEELQKYKKLENVVIGLIELNKTYTDIKQVISEL